MKTIFNLLFSFILAFVLNSFKLSSFFLGLGLFVIINVLQKNKREFNYKIGINAILFSLFLLIGITYQKGGTLLYLFSSFKNIILTIFYFGSFTYLLYLLIAFLLEKFINMKDKKINSKILNFLLDKHPFISVFLVTLAVSFFYLVFFYPGSMAWDGLWQLDFYYGITPFKDHHPALLTLFMGSLMDVGRYLLNDNLGMFLFILIQIIINALTYSYTILIMKKMNTPYLIRFLSFAFYAFFPFLVINSITYIKDTIFYLLFLFFVVYLYYHFYVVKNNSKIKYFVLLLLSLGLYFTRNTGFYICFITFLVFSVFLLKKEKRASLIFLGMSLVLLGVNSWYHNVFLVKMNILEAPVREKMSIPLQQTARYLKYYPNDINDKEKEALENVFDVSLNEIGKLYDPNRSDNVKFRFLIYPKKEELNLYYKAWLSMFFKHPFVYVDATLNNIYGYFYPAVVNFIGEDIGFYEIEVDGWVNDGSFKFKRNNLDFGRNILEDLATFIAKMPVINLLYTPAFYVWILISLTLYFVFKKKIHILIYFVPFFLVLGFCLASPVNAHMRYLQPVMVSIPFLLALFYKEAK